MAPALLALFAALGLLLLLRVPVARADGGLIVDLYSPDGQPLNAFNLVVDSNVESPSTYAPSVATVAVRFCNTSTATLTDVVGYIGTFDAVPSARTPGFYPRRYVDTAFEIAHPALTNGDASTYYAFTHVGATSDASRYIGTLAAGECRVQYWHFTYPQCENNPDGTADIPPCNSGNSPTWGSSVKPGDDLWLTFDTWATAAGGWVDSTSWKMTMRNEISAMANKIEPNPLGRWFNTDTSIVRPGDVITTNGVLYTFGNINQGFDNDGDFVPDYNAWAQPIGDRTFDPTCFRLIRTTTLLTVSRSGGLPNLLLNFTDQLYYTNLPSNNTGAIGEVRYTFLAIDGPCSLPLTPYQEVASGRDNEKFNGDYGTGIPPVVSSEPEVAIDKSGNLTVTQGSTITYAIAFQNNGDADAGLTLSSGWGVDMPLTISDSVPDGLQYVCGSATASLNYTPSASPGYTLLYSIDSGTTWSVNEPASCPGTNPTSSGPDSLIVLQWRLSDPLPKQPGSGPNTSSGTATFQARVPASGYTGDLLVENEACVAFGQNDPFACDDTTTRVLGDNTITGTVFEDDGSGYDFGDGEHDGSEGVISGTVVSLYILVDGDYVLWDTDTSDAGGGYSFTQLPNGDYRIVVGTPPQATHPGWTNTTDASINVTLNDNDSTGNDFGFAPALVLDKSLLRPSPAQEEQLVYYNIDLTNQLAGDGTAIASPCQYTIWGGAADTNYTDLSGNKEWNPYTNALGQAGPDGNYANSEFANTDENIGVTSFNLSAPGSLEQVDILLQIDVEDPATGANKFNTNDSLGVELIDTLGTVSTADDVIRYANTQVQADLNAYGLDPFPLTFTNISTANLTLANFNGSNYVLHVTGNGSAGPSYDAYIRLDAAGFRITTDQTCGGDAPSTTIDPLPLTDTYDAARLAFYAADPPASSVITGGASPYTNTGSIYWSNLGPLYAGGTRSVTVTFRVQDGTYGQTLTNTATVDSARFKNGLPANDATDSVTTTVARTARLGDFVWIDLNGDGNQDGGEAGIPGVIVRLTANVTVTVDGVDYPPGTVLTTTTDAAGGYLFTGLQDGTYTVTVDTASLPGSTFTPTFDRDGTLDHRTAVTLSGSDVLDADFGYQIPNTIFGTVWQDYDGDSNQDTGDGGISSVTVDLYWYNGSTWVVTATTTTDSSGLYTFSDLSDGQYYVQVQNTSAPLGTDWSNTRDPEGAPGDHRSNAIVASGGNLYGSYDFGYHQSGSYDISGTVYADWNGNADQGTGEPGFSGITVTLYSESGALIATTTTDASGAYTFTNLPDGDYRVVVDRGGLPSQYGQTEDWDESGACVTCDSQAGSVTVGGADVSGVDFGYEPDGSGSIGDTVWRDMNGDGTQAGPQETGIGAVTVWLELDLNGDGNYTRVATATTSGGTYLFPGLPDGTYRVVVDGSDGDLPQDAFGYTYIPSTPTTSGAISISGGSDYLDADFGFMPLGAVGDTLYWDANRNGELDWSESGLGAGIVVTLTNTSAIVTAGGTPYAPGTYVLTTTTDSAGQYFFTGLVSGTYSVTVGSIAGNPTLSGDPDTNGIPCDPDPGAPWSSYCDGETRSDVGPGTVYLGADFGYVPGGVIGDYVWLDGDGDGVQDAGEPGIAGVVVTVTNGSVTYTATTDFDGYYSFANLGDDTWSVTFATPPGTVATSGPQSVGGSTTVEISGGAVVSIGGSGCTGCSLNVDSGFRLDGSYSVSGHVFYDASGSLETNDLYGYPGDVPYENVTVYLWDASGSLVGITTTNSSGYYAFPGLPDGDYTVSVNAGSPQLDGMALTAVYNYELENYHSVTVSGGSVTDVDFGFYAAMDFGDLPANYNATLLADEGPYHVLGSLYLGAGIDPEGDGTEHVTAGADLLDDGVERGPLNWSNGVGGGSLVITVTGGSGYLVGWIDWDGDGDFGDGGELIVSRAVSVGAQQPLSFTVPAGTFGSAGNKTFNVRFRLFESAPAYPAGAYTGPAVNGEVEDYQWQFGPNAVTLSALNARAARTPYFAAVLGAVGLVGMLGLVRLRRRRS